MEQPDFPSEPALQIETLGGFRIWREGLEVGPAAWGREKALHLFQFLVTYRQARMHKEQIIVLLWPQADLDTGDRDFKVALNALTRAIEPERAPRAASRFVLRVEGTYQLNPQEMDVDADRFEAAVIAGNERLADHPAEAIPFYQQAAALYGGDYLPERRFMDWSSAERERLQTLALASMNQLGELLLEGNPLESLRLSEAILKIDSVWESAYRLQMQAHYRTGNRPLALRTYRQCQTVLLDEFALEPLPETQRLYEEIRSARAL